MMPERPAVADKVRNIRRPGLRELPDLQELTG